MAHTIYTYTCPYTHIRVSRDDEGTWSWLTSKDTADKVFGEKIPSDVRFYHVELGRVLQVLLERCQKSFGEEHITISMNKLRR